jgi:hypothetical protein
MCCLLNPEAHRIRDAHSAWYAWFVLRCVPPSEQRAALTPENPRAADAVTGLADSYTRREPPRGAPWRRLWQRQFSVFINLPLVGARAFALVGACRSLFDESGTPK